MLKLKFTAFLIIAYLLTTNAQQLVTPTNTFSHKKPAYITLRDGSEITVTLSKVERKKAQIKGIQYVNDNGKKVKLNAKDISHMYLPPSGVDKVLKAQDFLYDATKWNNEKLNQDFLNQGYAYFEQTEVKIKKKNHPLLMQVLNPDFNKYVTIYHDPMAKETASLGVKGVKVAGGKAKSYYVKLEGQSTAFLLTKKDYRKEFNTFYKDCKELLNKYKKAQWNDLTKHIIEYNEICGGN